MCLFFYDSFFLLVCKVIQPHRDMQSLPESMRFHPGSQMSIDQNRPIIFLGGSISLKKLNRTGFLQILTCIYIFLY